MNLATFLKLELKNFLSGKAVAVAICGIVVAGLYGIYHGRNVVKIQRENIAQIPQFQAEHTEKQLELNSADLGNLLYYHQFSTVDEPSSWAAFSIGQRDVNPFSIKVRMLTLEGQLYDSEISNPRNLLYGNFDLAFAIVFLFPLLIIAFCHSLISSEQENGVWTLLCSQPVSVRLISIYRLMIRFLLIVFLAFGLIGASCVIQGSSFDLRFAYVLLITFTYLAFWFAVAAAMISLGKSTTFNAVSLLGVWIVLTILAPALLNLAISTALPVSESFELTIKQREGYHQKWDEAKSEMMQRFYTQYPQYRDVPIPEDKFSWGWYYAAQLMGDLEAASATQQYMEKLELRDKWTNWAAVVLPTINTQLALNRLSGNDLRHHLTYLESVREFHTKIREHFYPFIFRDAKVDEVDWSAVPKHSFNNDSKWTTFPTMIFGVSSLTLFLSFVAWSRFGKYMP